MAGLAGCFWVEGKEFHVLTTGGLEYKWEGTIVPDAFNNLTGCVDNGNNTLTKTATGDNWNAFAHGGNSGSDYHARYMVSDNTKNFFVGLSKTLPITHWNQIDYAAYVYGTERRLLAYELGVSKWTGPVDGVVNGDVIGVRRAGSSVYLIQNDVVKATFPTAASGTYYVAIALFNYNVTYGEIGWWKVPGSCWIEGNDFHYIDAAGVERYFYGDDSGAKSGLAGSIWQESTFAAWLDANLKKRIGHGDVPHSDAPHVDTDVHSDVPHTDTHTDTHSDIAHSDIAHADSHTDWYDDVAYSDGHNDYHVDHTDTYPPHLDEHGDTHYDSHTDDHGDVPHSDVNHSDIAHANTHGDIAHADVPYSDHDDHSDHTDQTAHVDLPDYVGAT